MPARMPQPGTDEWWDAFNELSPEEQDNVLYDFEYNQATDLPWSLEGDNAPALDYGSYDLLGMGGGVDIPELTTKGAVDPYDLTQEAKRVNLAQDYGALFLDNILSGMTGPGAYDVDAFTPTYDYGEPLNLTGRRKAEAMSGAGGYEGFLAQQILDGRSPAEAEAALWSVVSTPEDDPDLSDQDRALKQSLLATLPSAQQSGDPTTGLPSAGSGGIKGREGRDLYDTKAVTNTAQMLWNGVMEDPEYTYFDEATGKFYDRTPEEAMVKTPQMEFFDKYGLPYPTASYADDEYVQAALDTQTGTDWTGRQMASQDFGQELAGIDADTERARAAFRTADTANRGLQQAWDDADLRPMTEWDAMLRAQDRGGDQRAARDRFDRLYPGANGRFETPQTGTAEGGLASVYNPTPAGRGAPLVRENPYVTTDRAGNVSPYNFEQGPQAEPLAAARSLLGMRGQDERPTVRRANRNDVEGQRKRRQDAATNVQRTSAQRQTAQYRDPALMELAQQAKMWAIAQQGRTPFNDAMALRRQGNRAMGL